MVGKNTKQNESSLPGFVKGAVSFPRLLYLYLNNVSVLSGEQKWPLSTAHRYTRRRGSRPFCGTGCYCAAIVIIGEPLPQIPCHSQCDMTYSASSPRCEDYVCWLSCQIATFSERKSSTSNVHVSGRNASDPLALGWQTQPSAELKNSRSLIMT